MPERFWLEKKDRWPSDWPDQYVFLISALEQAGKAIWCEAWQGGEGYVVAKGFPHYGDFARAARKNTPTASADEQRAIAHQKYDETVAVLSEYMARAKKVHRA